MNRHPYSAAWPDMSPEDFSALVASIETNGLSKPIVTFAGQILDGWHRYRACKTAGVEPHFQGFEGDDEAAVRFIEIEHTHRNLLAGQRVAAILAMHQCRPGVGRPGNHAPGARLTEPEIAQRAGASLRTVAQVKEVAAKAPDQLDRIRNGEASAKRVLAEIKGTPERRAEKVPAAACSRCQELEHEIERVRDGAQEAVDQAEAAAVLLGTDPGKEVVQLKGYVRTLEGRRDDLMRENAQLKREVSALRRRIVE